MEIVAGSESEGKTVFELLRRVSGISSRSLKRLKYREGGIKVNGENSTVRRILSSGDTVTLDVSEIHSEKDGVIPSDLPLSILYSDEWITVCDKPAGMPTHPVHGHLRDTLANALAFRSGRDDYVFRPLNRLDRNTSGIVVCSNDFVTSGRLFRQMSRGLVSKVYIGIAAGVPGLPEGIIDAPIVRTGCGTLMRAVGEGGDSAVTKYKVLRVSNDGFYSIVRFEPVTGRTHQIRVHAAFEGWPLLGDFLYGRESPLINRHALHCLEMSFFHPTDGRKLQFSTGLPPDMAVLVEKLFQEPYDGKK